MNKIDDENTSVALEVKKVSTRIDDKNTGVALRLRKISEGKSSYYLDYYNSDGKRVRESLKLFITDKPKNADERRINKETRELADKLHTAKKDEVYSGKLEYNKKTSGNVYFLDYLKSFIDSQKFNESNHSVWICTYKALQKICDNKILLKNVNYEFLNKLKHDLLNQYVGRFEKKLAINTASSYYRKVSACLKHAYKQELILKDPTINAKGIKEITNKREWLSHDELKLLAIDIKSLSVLKRAFIFGCLTGLRFSDISKLKWGEISDDDDGQFTLVFNQKKTDKLQNLPLPKQAIKMIGARQNNNINIFPELVYNSHCSEELQKWMNLKGINKKITFHCSRHTFAVLALKYGVDIYRLSKALGHSFIKTTEIYAEIINEKLKEAMNTIPNIFDTSNVEINWSVEID